MKCFLPICLVLLLVIQGQVFSLDLGLSVGAQAASNESLVLSPVLGLDGEFTSSNFDFFLDIGLKRDGKYPSPEPEAGGSYFLMKRGGIRLKGDNLLLEAGRIDPQDPFASPFSLFLSSAVHNPLSMRLDYDNGPFFYSSQWIGLNNNSGLFTVKQEVLDGAGVPVPDRFVYRPLDRGANFKSYGVRFLEHFRLAYEELSIYTGRYFDLEYFLNPIPGYFIQYVNISNGTPWKQTKPWGATDNGNFIMGFLLDYQDAGCWLGLQFLLDDINLNRFLGPDKPQNPDKIGLSLGWREDLEMGTLGVYAALVSKYTFEPAGTDPGDWYGASYWPASQYPMTADFTGPWSPLRTEDNNIAYIHGENTLALGLDYRFEKDPWKLYSFFEYRLSGPQSPSNPWHEYDTWQEGGPGPRWLGQFPLENRVKVEIEASYTLDQWTFTAGLGTGFIANKLQLVPSTEPSVQALDAATEKFMYRLVPGSAFELFGRLFIGARYEWQI